MRCIGLPPAYAERYGEIAVGGLRGGIMVPGVKSGGESVTVPFAPRRQ